MENSTKENFAFGTGGNAVAAYIEQNRDTLISAAVAQPTFMDYGFSVQDGVRNEFKIPLHDAAITAVKGLGGADTDNAQAFQYGTATLNPSFNTVYSSLDLRALRNTVLSDSLSPAGTGNQSFGWINAQLDQVVAKIGAAQEVDFFLGDDSVSGQEQDGIFRTAGLNAATGGAAITAANYKAQLDALIAAIPSANFNEDIIVMMSIGSFRNVMSGMLADGNRYIEPNVDGGNLSINHPVYANVQIVGFAGLGTQDRVIAGPKSDVYIGQDSFGAVDGSNLWYSQDDNRLKYRFEWASAQTLAHPTYWATNAVALT